VLPESAEFCSALGLDPLGLIASGSLLAAVAPGDARKLVDALAREGIAAYEIGRITDASEGLKLLALDGARDLPRFSRDELARYLAG
jgi:hydrogenase maturation factor